MGIGIHFRHSEFDCASRYASLLQPQQQSTSGCSVYSALSSLWKETGLCVTCKQDGIHLQCKLLSSLHIRESTHRLSGILTLSLHFLHYTMQYWSAELTNQRRCIVHWAEATALPRRPPRFAEKLRPLYAHVYTGDYVWPYPDFLSLCAYCWN